MTSPGSLDWKQWLLPDIHSLSTGVRSSVGIFPCNSVLFASARFSVRSLFKYWNLGSMQAPDSDVCEVMPNICSKFASKAFQRYRDVLVMIDVGWLCNFLASGTYNHWVYDKIYTPNHNYLTGVFEKIRDKKWVSLDKRNRAFRILSIFLAPASVLLRSLHIEELKFCFSIS